MISIMQPRYIIISARREKIIVVKGARTEKPPKDEVETARVALMAKTDAIIASIKYLIMELILLFGFSSEAVYSLKAIIPKVANADSHSEISIMALGVTIQIIRTATESEVSESFVLESRKSRVEIISITPARTTETEKPVIAI